MERIVEIPAPEVETESIRRHKRTGRPLGNDLFIDRLELEIGKSLRKKKPGPKDPRKKGN
jgi:putative transposase